LKLLIQSFRALTRFASTPLALSHLFSFAIFVSTPLALFHLFSFALFASTPLALFHLFSFALFHLFSLALFHLFSFALFHLFSFALFYLASFTLLGFTFFLLLTGLHLPLALFLRCFRVSLRFIRSSGEPVATLLRLITSLQPGCILINSDPAVLVSISSGRIQQHRFPLCGGQLSVTILVIAIEDALRHLGIVFDL
jgi:hypothetical protein